MCSSNVMRRIVLGLGVALVVMVILWPSQWRVRPTSGAPETLPDQVELRGIVRDFRRSHSDFNSIPAGGSGHVAALTTLSLDGDYNPTYSAAGWYVDEQWRDRTGVNIPPHLFVDGLDDVVPLGSSPNLSGHAVADTWDSSLGEYGGQNTGPAPTFAVGSTMPPMPPAPTIGPSTGNVTYSGNSMLSADLRCAKLTVRGTLRIAGTRTIVCEGLLRVHNNASIELLPGAELVVHVGGGMHLMTHASINKGGDWQRVTIYKTGTAEVEMHNHSEIVATLIAPAACLCIHNHGDFYGRYAGASLELRPHAGLHIDRRTLCGVAIDDSAGRRGSDGDGGITSSASFGEWFRDVLSVNQSTMHSIILTRNGSVYEYLTAAFHPIDGRLLGDEGDDHNRHFTYEVAADFTFDACTGQFVEFEGGDGAWLFIDGKLAIDLGGVDPGVPQRLDLDRLELTDGQRTPFRLFYAQRSGRADFRLRTNVLLTTERYVPSISASYD